MGMSYATLPAGSATINKNGVTYYLNGNTWFKPVYGANGVHYQVVPAPCTAEPSRAPFSRERNAMNGRCVVFHPALAGLLPLGGDAGAPDSSPALVAAAQYPNLESTRE
jgi:hypothetical protein